jgi:surface antigen
VPGFARTGYRGSGPARLCVAVALALCAGGCSMSYQLDSMFSKNRGDRGVETTGSIRAPLNSLALSQDSDLAAARAAVNEALSKAGKDTSTPWENPTTGARGSITPLAAAYTQDGSTCRDFLASYVREGTESWLQGEACRGGQGRWEVRHMKPWRRT